MLKNKMIYVLESSFIDLPDYFENISDLVY